MTSVKYTRIILSAVIVLFCTYSPPAFAGARGVTISPTRVIFDGRNRSSVVYIVNPDNKEVTYRISLTNLRMNEKGRTEEVLSPDPDEIQAKGLIRFAPRLATLSPGGKQAIRLMVRKPYKLADGEYRVHLKVAPIPDEKRDRKNVPENEDTGTHIKIDLMVGVTIPVIVRHGELSLNITPDSAVVKKDPKTLKDYLEVGLERNGNRSAVIDVQAYYQSGPGKKQIQIGQANGIAIYTPNKRRITEIPLTRPINTTQGGMIRIVIHESEEGRHIQLGARDFPVEKIILGFN